MNNKQFSNLNPHSLLWSLMLIAGMFSWQAGHAQPGSSISLDGTGDYVTIASSSQNNITGTTITLEAWIYPTAWKGNYYEGSIIVKEGANAGYMLYCGNSGQLGFGLADGSSSHTVTSSTGALSLSKWQHVAGTYDGSTMRLYINGVQVASSSSSFSFVGTSNNLMIGYSAHTAGREFQGRIDEARIWNTTRSYHQLLSTQYKELAGTESGLAAYFKMSNGSGSTLTDNVSSGGTNGTLVGSTIWKTSTARLGSASDGLKYRRAGTGLDFDGTNDYVSIDDKAPIDLTNTFTIEAWINPSSLSGSYSRILGKGDGYGLGLNNTAIRFSAYGIQDYSLSYTVATNAWTHVAVVMDASNDVTFYVNGINKGTVAGASPCNVNASALYLGASSYNGGEEYFTGKIDEVRIWSAARTATQIQDNMLVTVDETLGTLAALFRMDDATSTTVDEATTNDMNGTLTNMDAANDWVSATGREALKVWLSTGIWTNDSVYVLGTAPNGNTNSRDWVELTRGVTISGVAGYAGNINIPTGITMTNNASQAINLNGNLINNGAMSGTTGQVRFQDSTQQPILTGTGTFTTGQFRVSTPQGLYLDQNITVATTLNVLSGTMYLNSNTLTLNGSFSISGAISGGSTSNLVIGGSGGATSVPAINLNNLTISKTNGVLLTGNMRIDGVLALNSGKLNINNNTLTLGPSATVTTSSSFSTTRMIQASLNKVIKEFTSAGSFFFPIGDGNPTYAPINLDFTSGTFGGSANVSVQVFNYTHPDNNSADNRIDRYWQVIENDITGFSLDVVATYDDGDIAGFVADETQLKSARWDGTNWLIMGDVDLASNYVYGTVTDLYAYSDFTAGEESFFATLPVEMLSFTAEPNGNDVDLKWSTAQEINSDYYVVERAADGKSFSPIGKVAAAGTTASLTNYAHMDENPVEGVNYYRLRQVDTDGTVHLSNTVEVSIQKAGIELFPNPTTDGFWIVVPEDMTGSLFITNSVGKAVKVVTVTGGKQYVSTAGISAGVYYGAFVLRGLKNVVEKIVIK